ncbi:hypothetical protein TKK_0014519 [Trichogramma kaykai]
MFLKDNPDIFFTNSDKGNVTVCLNRNDYVEAMNGMLSDRSTYKKIAKNPIVRLQSGVFEILQYYNDNDFLSYKYHKNNLNQTNTILAKCYGLPKIHKPSLSFRPIISTINSPTHFLASVLYNNLKSCVHPPPFHINNSFGLM